VRATCEFKAPGAGKACGAEARWVADVRWLEEGSAYEGTSWNVALCDAHYEQLRTAGRITGTAHEVAG
jgi:hypothetical protein